MPFFFHIHPPFLSISLSLISEHSLIVKSQQYCESGRSVNTVRREFIENVTTEARERIVRGEGECERRAENEGGYIDTKRRWFLFSVCERDHEWSQDGVLEQMKTVIG